MWKCLRVTCECCLFTELALRRCNRDTWRTSGLDLTRPLQLVKAIIQSLHVLNSFLHFESILYWLHCKGNDHVYKYCCITLPEHVWGLNLKCLLLKHLSQEQPCSTQPSLHLHAEEMMTRMSCLITAAQNVCTRLQTWIPCKSTSWTVSSEKRCSGVFMTPEWTVSTTTINEKRKSRTC